MKKLKKANERDIKNWSIKSKSVEIITDRKSFYDGMNFTLNYVTAIAKSSPAMKSRHLYYLPLHLKSKMP